MSRRDQDVSTLPVPRRHKISRSLALFGVVLRIGLLFQYSGGAEDVASFGENPVTQQAIPDSKTLVIQPESAGEHQNWAIHVDAV